MNDHQFRQLLSYFGLSWQGYRKVRKGVKKRLCRHMHALGCRTVEQYLTALEESQDRRQACKQLMTVSISRFLRDRHLWQCLENEILPLIIKAHRRKIRVWSAGCALGEEVYSFKMLWHSLERVGPLPHLDVTASDMNPEYLEKAREGVYPSSSLKEVPEPWRDLYFEAGVNGKVWAIQGYLKKGIVWQLHDFLSGAPGTGFDIVFLRNSLLTYYEDRLKVSAFRDVVNSLNPGGFLIIGAHERIPAPARGLSAIPCHSCALQKKA